MFDRGRALPDKIRIGHVVGWLHFGGKENGIVNLVNSLDSNLFENYIFSFVKNGSFKQRVDPARCRVVELGEKLGGDYRLYFKLAQAFRSHRIHIAHTHAWGTLLEGFVAARLARVPIVVHGEHGTIKDATKTHIYIQRLLWRLTDQVLSVSEVLRQKLCETVGFPKERIRVVTNGVDLSRFGVTGHLTDYKSALGLRPDTLTFGTVGRLVPVKCYPVLLQASRLILEQHPTACLIVVGDGPLHDELTAMVRQYNVADRVKFLGWRSDVSEILKALDVFVLASESEGMSNTILEAMASGRPVVATSVGGNVELVVEGETGLLVPPGDPKALAEAVTTLLRDPPRRSQMGQLGRQRASEYFSLETMARNYASFYLEIFSRRFKLSENLAERVQPKKLAALTNAPVSRSGS
jgi:sugar transferase (PEP-CTERM/EpsH1 system associated)